MKYFRLVLRQLFAKKTRTILTLLSLVMAFLLFGLLQAVNVAFNTPSSSSVDRLITQARVSFTSSLPMRMLTQLEAVKGVSRVYFQQWFGAEYRERTNQIVAFAVDPARLRDVYSEWVMPEEQWKAFSQTRTGLIVGRQLADRFNWKVGEKIPLNSNIWPQQDGSKAWTFDLVGIFDGRDEDAQKRAGLAYIQFDYFDEARQFGRGMAGMYTLKLASATDAERVSAEVDRMFENSADETKTQSEQEFQLNFGRQLGNIGLMVSMILAVVFFTILLLTGNTMAQAARERIPQFAILKTLGFSDGLVMWLLLTETLLLVLLGAILGMFLSQGFSAFLVSQAPQFAQLLDINGEVWLHAGLAVLFLTLCVGLPPALRARRLRIVDALAGR